MVSITDVITNLEKYDSWDYKSYPLSQSEAEAVIRETKRHIPKPIKAQKRLGDKIILGICECGYNVSSQEKYCLECGQRLLWEVSE